MPKNRFEKKEMRLPKNKFSAVAERKGFIFHLKTAQAERETSPVQIIREITDPASKEPVKTVKA